MVAKYTFLLIIFLSLHFKLNAQTFGLNDCIKILNQKIILTIEQLIEKEFLSEERPYCNCKSFYKGTSAVTLSIEMYKQKRNVLGEEADDNTFPLCLSICYDKTNQWIYNAMENEVKTKGKSKGAFFSNNYEQYFTEYNYKNHHFYFSATPKCYGPNGANVYKSIYISRESVRVSYFTR